MKTFLAHAPRTPAGWALASTKLATTIALLYAFFTYGPVGLFMLSMAVGR